MRFLDRLSEKGDVRAAAAFVGMSRQSAYVLRRRDAVFAYGWTAALVLARRHAEEVLATRALDGIEEAVWFRGELVGTRRKFDSRLLLAHLERLDRQALEPVPAGAPADLAERFDELLALVAGAVPDPLLICHPDAPGDPDPVLPPPREVFAEAAAHDACANEIEVFEDALERGAAAPGDEPLRDPVQSPVQSRAQWREQFCALWDGWRDDAFARVDAALGVGDVRPGRPRDGEVAVRSADGGEVRPDAASCGAASPLHRLMHGRSPSPDRGGLIPPDRVNCVNLSPEGVISDYRAWATVRLTGRPAGNAWGLSLLSL